MARPRRFFGPESKLRVIQDVEQGESQAAVARKYDLSPHLIPGSLTAQEGCVLTAVTRSTFYYRQQRSDVKQQEDQKIIARLEQLAREFARYGVRRMTAQHEREGFVVNRKPVLERSEGRVYRLMQEQNLLCKTKKRFVVTTPTIANDCTQASAILPPSPSKSNKIKPTNPPKPIYPHTSHCPENGVHSTWEGQATWPVFCSHKLHSRPLHFT